MESGVPAIHTGQGDPYCSAISHDGSHVGVLYPALPGNRQKGPNPVPAVVLAQRKPCVVQSFLVCLTARTAGSLSELSVPRLCKTRQQS